MTCPADCKCLGHNLGGYSPVEHTCTELCTEGPIARRKMSDLIELRATAAIRRENLRIATKHREEAGARKMSGPNKHAYEGALKWESTCRASAERASALLVEAQA